MKRKLRDIPNTNEIKAYLHCGKCFDEWQSDPLINATVSPRDYARTQAGWTTQGIQIWCNRHECNVLHMDFDGAKHRANTSAACGQPSAPVDSPTIQPE